MVPENGHFRMPMEAIQALMPAMRELGLPMPGNENLVPKINLDTPVREMGIQVGQLLRRAGLYRYGTEERLIIFVKNRRVDMEPVKFCSWIEKHAIVVKAYKGRGNETYDAPVSMGKDLAAKLLACEELLGELPRLQAILPTRVPVLRRDGRYELCKVGWDEEAEIFCQHEIHFELDWTLERAMKHFESLHEGFLFAELGAGGLWANRSFLVHFSACVGVFVRSLLPPGTMRPMVLYLANDQGSGKSLLVAMALAGCFGLAGSADLPMSKGTVNPEKLTALLETVAQSMLEYLWLDDVPPTVFSNSLNRFITASKHTGRKYGGNDEMFQVKAVTQVFMTGNQVEPTRDLMQRVLACELFLPMDSQTRKFTKTMTPEWLAETEQRAGLLSALWAFVRNWIEQGASMGAYIQGRAPNWSYLVGGVIEALGVIQNPFAVPELPTGGDRETDEWQALLVALADLAEAEVTGQDDKHYEVDTTRIVDMARKLKLLVDLVGSSTDKDLKGGELKKLGRRLGKWRGREDLVTSSGRRFQFGKRKQSSHWVYPISWLDPWPADDDDAEAPAAGAVDFAAKLADSAPAAAEGPDEADLLAASVSAEEIALAAGEDPLMQD